MAVRQHSLLVDSDAARAAEIACALDTAGWTSEHVLTGRAADRRLVDGFPDAIIVSEVLADGSGLELAETVRAAGFDGPVLLVLAGGRDTAYLMRCLERGCSDYVSPPVDMPTLLHRLRDAVERSRAAEGVMRLGDVQIDRANRTVSINGRLTGLTRREYDLLAFLAQRAGQGFDRHSLLAAIVPDGEVGHPHEIDAMVTSLRRRLGRTVIAAHGSGVYSVPSTRGSNASEPEFMQ